MSRDSDEPKDNLVVGQTEDGGWYATTVLGIDGAKKQLEDAGKLMSEDPRAAVLLSLWTVADFILEQGFDPDLLIPLRRLANQLHDLDKGFSCPLFEPRRAEG